MFQEQDLLVLELDILPICMTAGVKVDCRRDLNHLSAEEVDIYSESHMNCVEGTKVSRNTYCFG